jgi:hypothetical protein
MNSRHSHYKTSSKTTSTPSEESKNQLLHDQETGHAYSSDSLGGGPVIKHLAMNSFSV